jgi:hypothetical protein
MDNEMPPLPETDWKVWCQHEYEGPYYSNTPGYTDDDMRDYARAAVSAVIDDLCAWMEPQRADVPASGADFAAAIREKWQS